jgi:hypothetical protein
LEQISHILQVPIAFFFEGAPDASVLRRLRPKSDACRLDDPSLPIGGWRDRANEELQPVELPRHGCRVGDAHEPMQTTVDSVVKPRLSAAESALAQAAGNAPSPAGSAFPSVRPIARLVINRSPRNCCITRLAGVSGATMEPGRMLIGAVMCGLYASMARARVRHGFRSQSRDCDLPGYFSGQPLHLSFLTGHAQEHALRARSRWPRAPLPRPGPKTLAVRATTARVPSKALMRGCP